MINVFKKEDGHSASNDWVESHFSFSFGNYYDSDNVRFGPMRVLNDDTIQPNKGFGIHPHREAEVVSIAITGQLKHEDSLGNSGVIEFGQVQRMTAGTGILHSEINPSETEPGRFLQLWFFPHTKQLPPSYEDVKFDVNQLTNQLLPVVAPSASAGVAMIHQDLTIYLSKLEQGESLDFNQEEDRGIFVYVISGAAYLDNEHLIGKQDSARITNLSSLHIKAEEDCFFMLIDLPGGDL